MLLFFVLLSRWIRPTSGSLRANGHGLDPKFQHPPGTAVDAAARNLESATMGAKVAPDAFETKSVGAASSASDASASSSSYAPTASLFSSSSSSSSFVSAAQGKFADSGASASAASSAFTSLSPSLAAHASAARSASAAAKSAGRRFFVWISDAHNDPYYGVEGSGGMHYGHYGVCGRKVNGTRIPNFTKEDAAQWPIGAYGCDPPYSLWESALRAASRESKGAEFVVFTGDSVRHREDRLLNPLDNVTNIIGTTSQMLVDHFARFSPDHLILGTLGNTDSPRDYEINITETSTPNPWLEKIGTRLENVGALRGPRKEKYERGGYFSTKVGGLTILSINTLIYAKKHRPRSPFHKDPFGQFGWLRRKLQNASDANEHVWIVGHIPPGLGSFDFIPLWHDEYVTMYLDIVQDAVLGSIVKGQLFGHVHADEIRILPAAPPEAGPVLLIGAVSPIYYNNPSFRVVEYDESSGELVDFKVFWANLSESFGKSGDLDWQFGYNLMGTYPSLQEAGSAGRNSVLNRGMVKFAQSLESSWRSNATSSEWSHFVDWYKTHGENHLMAISGRGEGISGKHLSDQEKQRVAKGFFCALNITTEEAFQDCIRATAASIDERQGPNSPNSSSEIISASIMHLHLNLRLGLLQLALCWCSWLAASG